MAVARPWYKIVDPREDLRQGRPLDASEFAVHLDKVRDGTAPDDYSDPRRFFDRTYLTKNLSSLGSEVLRRLSGNTTETSAVFNLATQFGGGKTHALALLYHLAEGGPAAQQWAGVSQLMHQAGVGRIPASAVATFVGTEFDSITGRGGDDGAPLRRTPWGEIAWQLGREASFAAVAQHESALTAPAGDVIRKMLPKDRPSLILIDELMNYVSRNRRSGLATQLYDFIQNLSETARGETNVVLAVSIPASELEMTAEDQADCGRFKKMLDRLGKAVVMSAEAETSEIIRRRLFDWEELPRDAKLVADEYAGWILDHREQVPKWFPVDHAREAIEATYPFHPMALSVFERKWQALPRFQQTRGVLRLLALWVSAAYVDGVRGGHKDQLIGLGTAPLHDTMFRTAVFEQLGEQRLEGAVTTDICGKKESHATRLDAEAVDTVKKARLHRKVATTIFFESNGGQARTGEATLPEVRLAVGEPGLDIGNVETALEQLTDACYYLQVDRNKYRFGLTPNLNKLLADRRANVEPSKVEERIREEILKVFEKRQGVEVVSFPEKSNQVPDRPVLSLVILPPNYSMAEKRTLEMAESMTREYGNAGRTFKSALLFSVIDSDASLRDEARKLLAWQAIKDEEEKRLDETQRVQLAENLKKAQRDLRECVWRSYKNILLLGKDNQLKVVDLGLVHSSQAESMVRLIIDRLSQDGDIEAGISPNFLVRNWPPAFVEWSTKSVRDAFFASAQFPRLLDGNVIKDTIARGVSSGLLAYVGRAGDRYSTFIFESGLPADEIDISEDMAIMKAEDARPHVEPPRLTTLVIKPELARPKPAERIAFTCEGLDQHGRGFEAQDVSWTSGGGEVDGNGSFVAGDTEGEFPVQAKSGNVTGHATVLINRADKVIPPPIVPKAQIRGITWSGELPHQKWMNFYTKVLTKHVGPGGLKLRVVFEVEPEGGMPVQREEETKAALQELGLDDDVQRLP